MSNGLSSSKLMYTGNTAVKEYRTFPEKSQAMLVIRGKAETGIHFSNIYTYIVPFFICCRCLCREQVLRCGIANIFESGIKLHVNTFM